MPTMILDDDELRALRDLLTDVTRQLYSVTRCCSAGEFHGQAVAPSIQWSLAVDDGDSVTAGPGATMGEAYARYTEALP